MTFYFHAIRAVDVVIAAACAKALREAAPSSEAELIVTRFPQFDYSSVSTVGVFSKVRYLPYCDYKRDLWNGLPEVFSHYCALAGADYGDNSVFFVFDDSEVACLNIYRLVDALRRKGRKVKIVHLVYVVNPMSYGFSSGARVAPLRTLLTSAYSVPVIGRPLVCRSIPSTASFDRGLDFSRFDEEAFFFCDAPPGHAARFSDMPAPFELLAAADFSSVTEVQPGSVLFLADRLKAYVPDAREWATLTGAVISRIRTAYPVSPLYVKMHPTDSPADYSGLDLAGARILDKGDSLEKLFALNRSKIAAAFSFMSSGLFSSAALGIPSCFLYPLLRSGAERERFFDQVLMRNNLGIVRAGAVESIAALYPAGKTEGRRPAERWREFAEKIQSEL